MHTMPPILLSISTSSKVPTCHMPMRQSPVYQFRLHHKIQTAAVALIRPLPSPVKQLLIDCAKWILLFPCTQCVGILCSQRSAIMEISESKLGLQQLCWVTGAPFPSCSQQICLPAWTNCRARPSLPAGRRQMRQSLQCLDSTFRGRRGQNNGQLIVKQESKSTIIGDLQKTSGSYRLFVRVSLQERPSQEQAVPGGQSVKALCPGHPHVCVELGFLEGDSLGLEARGRAELGTLQGDTAV